MSNSTRCAACKSLRRKCPQDCVLAPYFPSTETQRFANVHRIFGASNITKMLQQVPEHLRREAADSMCFEASLRVEDPVYGCVGIISQLQQEIIQTENDIIKTKGEIAFHNAQRRQQQQQLQQLQDQQQIIDVANDEVEGDQAAFSFLSSIGIQQNPNHSVCQQPFEMSTLGFFHI